VSWYRGVGGRGADSSRRGGRSQGSSSGRLVGRLRGRTGKQVMQQRAGTAAL
jgi:hypothetical protein